MAKSEEEIIVLCRTREPSTEVGTLLEESIGERRGNKFGHRRRKGSDCQLPGKSLCSRVAVSPTFQKVDN